MENYYGSACLPVTFLKPQVGSPRERTMRIRSSGGGDHQEGEGTLNNNRSRASAVGGTSRGGGRDTSRNGGVGAR